MSINRELYRLRRSLGLCTVCGTPLQKEGGKYRYACPECRAKREAQKKRLQAGDRDREERAAERARAELAQAARRPARESGSRAPEKCVTCVWASYAGGGIWFCPLVGCAKSNAFATLDNALMR